MPVMPRIIQGLFQGLPLFVQNALDPLTQTSQHAFALGSTDKTGEDIEDHQQLSQLCTVGHRRVTARQLLKTPRGLHGIALLLQVRGQYFEVSQRRSQNAHLGGGHFQLHHTWQTPQRA